MSVPNVDQVKTTLSMRVNYNQKNTKSALFGKNQTGVYLWCSCRAP